MKKTIISDSVYLRERNGKLKEPKVVLIKNTVVEFLDEFAEYNGLVRIKAKNGAEGWVQFSTLEE